VTKKLKVIYDMSGDFKRQPHLELIHWHDHSSPGVAWSDLTDLCSPHRMKIFSVGWIVYEDENVLVTVPTTSTAGGALGSVKILKPDIVKRWKITDPSL